MDQRIETIRKDQDIKLEESERKLIRENLAFFINASIDARIINVSKSPKAAGISSKKAIKSPWTGTLFFLARSPMSLALIVALFVGSGVSLASEGSLPGDLLYPVKIGLNEQFRGAIAISDEAEAEWQTEKVERRLREAAELSSEGRLSAELSAESGKKFDEAATKARERIAKLKERGDSQAALRTTVRLESALRVHQSLVADSSKTADASLSGLVTQIKLNTEVAEKDRVRATHVAATEIQARTAEDNKNFASKKIKEIERKLSQGSAYIERYAKDSVKAGAKAKLDVAAQKLSKAKEGIDTGAYEDATLLFADAERIVAEARELADAYGRLKIEAKNNSETASLIKEGGENTLINEARIETRRDSSIDSSGSAEKSINVEINSARSIKTEAEAATGSKLDLGL